MYIYYVSVDVYIYIQAACTFMNMRGSLTKLSDSYRL